jgi:glycerol-3-phosphate dehydrogenase
LRSATFDRADHVAALGAERFDLLVVGGGITGCGVALDAASRGLRVALVERHDFASGTSSKSSKLVHGGLRYLQQGDIRLVYEALHERRRLMRNAPHLVSIQPFLLPIFTKDGLINAKMARAIGSAMWMYDLTGGWRIGKRHRRLKQDETLAQMPTLAGERLAAGYLFYDCRADDARLTLTLARTAALDHGAVVVNRAAVTGLRHGPDGRIAGAEIHVDGAAVAVDASVVVNATGVWVDDLRTMDEGQDPDMIRPAKGMHITVPWDRVRNEVAVILPVPKDKRSIFVVREGDLCYVGTTDTDYDGPLDDPQCTPEDIDYLLSTLNSWTTERIERSDVVGTWAGLRPLVRGATSDRTADLSRRHSVVTSDHGLVTVTGGKLTTYREMAGDTVDAAAKMLPDDVDAGRSRTKRLPLRGHDHRSELQRWVKRGIASQAVVDHLDGRYGGDARVVLAMLEGDAALARPIVPGLPYLRAEAVYAARHEMATTIDDVLSRRTRARLWARDDSADAADDVAELIGGVLGWDEERRADAAADYRASVATERAAPDLPETHLADLIGA